MWIVLTVGVVSVWLYRRLHQVVLPATFALSVNPGISYPEEPYLIREFLLNDAVSHLLKTPWVIAAVRFFNARWFVYLTVHKHTLFPAECSYVFRVIPAISLYSCGLIGVCNGGTDWRIV